MKIAISDMTYSEAEHYVFSKLPCSIVPDLALERVGDVVVLKTEGSA